MIPLLFTLDDTITPTTTTGGRQGGRVPRGRGSAGPTPQQRDDEDILVLIMQPTFDSAVRFT